MENQREHEKNRKAQRTKLAELMPDLMKGISGLTAEAYRDGVLSCKVKKLMALALALGTGCKNCILSKTMEALENGATREEFLETISVVVSMRGTTGVGESLRVIQLLDELGRL